MDTPVKKEREDCFAVWCRMFKAHRGGQYRPTGKDKGIISHANASWQDDDVELLKSKIKQYLYDPDPFAARLGHPFWHFIEYQNKYEG